MHHFVHFNPTTASNPTHVRSLYALMQNSLDAPQHVTSFQGILSRLEDLRDQEGEYYVALDEERRHIDASALYSHIGKRAFIEALAVQPELQRKGIGRFMVENMIHISRLRGIERLHVESLTRSVAFYRKLGFQAVSSTNDLISMERLV